MEKRVLWAPWRMEYIRNGPPKGGCVFCALPLEKDPRKSLVVHATDRVYVVLNKFPYNNGHLLVVPRAHHASPEDLDAETAAELMTASQTALRSLRKAYSPQGFNVGMNVGRAAGAGIPEHLHIHVVPRWESDTNFMPILSETKALPQHLMTSYDVIKEAFKES